MKHLPFVLLLLIPAYVPSYTDDSQGYPVGFIESIEGTVFLGSDGKPLDKNEDRGRVLFSKEVFRCSPGARAKGAYLSGGKFVAVANFCGPLPEKPPGDKVETQNAELQESLSRLGRRSGRNKGSESPIFEPAPGASILPEAMMVRWRTHPPLDNFTAILQDASGKSIAEVPGVDGSKGILDSTALRNALLGLRTADLPASAILVLRTSGGDEYKSAFSVLSQNQELELKRKLSEASVPGGLLAFVLRADVLSSYGLYNNTAVEYGHALEVAPSSLQFLRAALDAYSRIGDLVRAREIRDCLDKAESE
jgi:hypothetical protein